MRACTMKLVLAGVVLTPLLLTVSGCSTIAYQWQLRRDIAEANRLGKEAGAEMDRRCQVQPESCKLLVDFDDKKGPDDPRAWSTKMRPSYRIWFDKSFGNSLKAFTTKWTGLEYFAEVGRAVTDQMDSGIVDPHDGYRLMYEARQQAKDMIREEHQNRVQELRRRDAEAAANISQAMLAVAVAGLEAYASSRNMQPRTPLYALPAANLPPPARVDARPAASSFGRCTYRLWALGGQALCAMSDGTVTAH